MDFNKPLKLLEDKSMERVKLNILTTPGAGFEFDFSKEDYDYFLKDILPSTHFVRFYNGIIIQRDHIVAIVPTFYEGESESKNA